MQTRTWIGLVLGIGFLGSASGCPGDDTPGTDEVGSETATDTGTGTEDEVGSSGMTTDDDSCPVGAEGCPCTGGGACDQGLMCMDGTCVPEDGTSSDTTTDSTDDTTDSTDTTDTTGGGVCGDGMVEGNEECDDGPNNNDLVQGACRTDCTMAGCGDAVVDYVLGEQCDDGGVALGDGCDDVCQVEVGNACGDGILDIDLGEQCDDDNNAANDGCSPNCQFEVIGANCGDGMTDADEICDDNNTSNGDTCNATCNLGNTSTLFVGAPGVAGQVDGTGQNARIGGPGALAVDNTYLWLADGANRTVRRIQISNAQVVTIAGDAVGGAPGDVDSPNGLTARFAGVEAITTDSNFLWVADSGNHKLKRITLTAPYAVTTVAGSGAQAVTDGIGNAAAFDDLRGVTWYAGMVYMLDANGAVLRRFDPQTQEVLTIAGQVGNPGVADGFGLNAQFISPRYMVSDNSGTLYISDTNGYHIRYYNIAQDYVGTFAGTGVQGYTDGIGTMAAVHRPRGMASDGTSIYWAEFNQHTIRQGILASGSVTTLLGQHCNGAMVCSGGYTEGVGIMAQLDGPYGLAWHFPSNSLFVLDSTNRVIRRIQ
jgi:cysteine-rich repeat protein